MSERAEELAARLDTELSRMIEFLSGLTDSQLDAACKDPQGATVRHVLAHLREGTEQVVVWAANVAAKRSGAGNDPSNANEDGSNANLDRSNGNGDRSSGGAAAHHPAPSVPSDQPNAELEQTVTQLRDGGAVIVGAIRGLTDQQLDFVPPASPGLADGATPLHGIVAFIADDVAGHLDHLTKAVVDSARAPRTVA
jgi:DinB superfamily